MRKQYEYQTVLSQQHRGQAVLDRVNAMALKGWRVVGIMHSTYVMEREFVPEPLFRGKPISELNKAEMEEYVDWSEDRFRLQVHLKPSPSSFDGMRPSGDPDSNI